MEALNMKYKAEIRQVPEYLVYCREYYVSDLYEFFREMENSNFLQDLSDRVLKENPGIRLTEPDYNVLVFLDGEFSDNNVRLEFCDAVTGLGVANAEYGFKTVREFTALNILHKGPYRDLNRAYAFADRWMKKNGYRKAGCPRNSAIDGFWNKDREEDYLTEIQIPVEKMMLHNL